MIEQEKTKSFAVSKHMVYNSYLKVVSKGGSAGIDKQSIAMFEKDMSKQLYKIWNRMSSGSYYPPAVRTVFIPKKQGGLRPLGIPTIGDRIAQGVVKDYLEPLLDPIFHNSSFGYRRKRSAHDALGQCYANCREYAWVVDVDIKGFFDHIDHTIMLALLQKHIEDKWVLLYVERWLKAGIEDENGRVRTRSMGTPQGGVISPLLANLYLHYAFDTWMEANFPDNPFERYADDIVTHCKTKEEAYHLLQALETQMSRYLLTLHPEKTKVVYCKHESRKEQFDQNSFTFLSYTFRPRAALSMYNPKRTILLFNGAISNTAKASIRQSCKKILRVRRIDVSLEAFAEVLNPKIRGWINYYGKFYKLRMIREFGYLDGLIQRWISHKYRLKSKIKTLTVYKRIKLGNPELFYHWQPGIKKVR